MPGRGINRHQKSKPGTSKGQALKMLNERLTLHKKKFILKKFMNLQN